MVSDSRQISLNTAFPLYKIFQLKTELFLKPTNQNAETCEWWLRLYHGEATKDDIRRVESEFKKYAIA